MANLHPSDADSTAALRALAVERPDASRLHLARVMRGMTTQQLADRARLHFNTVYRIERHGRRPSYATAARLASALDLPVGDLFDAHEQLVEVQS